MDTMRKSTIALALFLVSIPVIRAQDLSKYRTFSLGASLTTIAQQVNGKPEDASVIHQSPAVIQDLIWWPIEAMQTTGAPDAVQQIRFSFCNRELYSIAATYEGSATRGMTDDDMVKAVSATYGTATRPPNEASVTPSVSYGPADVRVALWENAQYSVTLSRSPISDSFHLTLSSKQLKGEADAAIAVAVRQETADAAGEDITRQKKNAADLESERQANLKVFRP
jgi:hypothetical protein